MLICIGFVFLVIGFLSMYRIRMVVKNEGTGKHEGLEKLMLKIGVFSSLYLVSHFTLSLFFFPIARYESYCMKLMIIIALTQLDIGVGFQDKVLQSSMRALV